MTAALNLLQYPLQARLRLRRWRVGTGLAGVLLGLAAGGAWGLWQHRELPGLSQTHARLQAQAAQRHHQSRQDQERQTQALAGQAQLRHLSLVVQQQQAWAALNAAVLQEARRGAWVLERLYADGERLALHGRAVDAAALGEAQRRLSDALQQPLTLVSLAANPRPSSTVTAPPAMPATPGMSVLAGPGGGLAFVWQGHWPAVAALPASSAGQARRSP